MRPDYYYDDEDETEEHLDNFFDNIFTKQEESRRRGYTPKKAKTNTRRNYKMPVRKNDNKRMKAIILLIGFFVVAGSWWIANYSDTAQNTEIRIEDIFVDIDDDGDLDYVKSAVIIINDGDPIFGEGK